MLPLCSILQLPYYAQNYAGIIGSSLTAEVLITIVASYSSYIEDTEIHSHSQLRSYLQVVASQLHYYYSPSLIASYVCSYSQSLCQLLASYLATSLQTTASKTPFHVCSFQQLHGALSWAPEVYIAKCIAIINP